MMIKLKGSRAHHGSAPPEYVLAGDLTQCCSVAAASAWLWAVCGACSRSNQFNCCNQLAAPVVIRQPSRMRRKRDVGWQHSVECLWWRVWQIHILLLLLLRLLGAGLCTIWLLMHMLKLLQLKLLLCSLLPGRVQHGSDSSNVHICSAVQSIKVDDCLVLCCDVQLAQAPAATT